MKTYKDCLINFHIEKGFSTRSVEETVEDFIATHPEYAGAPLPVLTHDKLLLIHTHAADSNYSMLSAAYYEEFCKAFPELVGGTQPEPEQPKQWTPQVGEEVEVSDGDGVWNKRNFLGVFNGYFMVQSIFTGLPAAYKLCRPINKPVTLTTSEAIEIIKSAKGIIGEVVIKEDEK